MEGPTRERVITTDLVDLCTMYLGRYFCCSLDCPIDSIHDDSQPVAAQHIGARGQRRQGSAATCDLSVVFSALSPSITAQHRVP